MQVWRQALGSDPVYASARAAYRAGLEQLPQARAGLLPAVSAEVGGAYQSTHSTRGFTAYDGTRADWALVLTQPLFDWNRWQRYEQSQLRVADTELQLQQSFQDLLLRVADAYFNVLAAQDTLSATEAEKAAVSEQLAAAQRNFELGNATIADSYEARARYDLVVARELDLQNALDVRRDELAQIIGTPPGALAELPSGVSLPAPQPSRIDEWSGQAESSGISVLRAQLQTRIAGHDIQIARSGHYPTVNLRASSGSATDARMRQGSEAPGRPIDNSIGVVLSIPLYSGGGVSSLVTEKVQLEQKARQDYQASRRQAVQSARRYYSGVTSGLARIRALEAGERSSRQAVEANRIGYEVGVRINQDVLDAQQQLYATQRDLAQARYGALLDGLRLKAVSGILAESDLDAVNRLLRLPKP
ncbi:outer membrane protein [Bordetella ansorpii]|uniref:Outer membrane protein n=2 Tax=Bordetella ansorpii TaxID=288768 RepID=A0A157QT92_9BORD|nr:outer membrane protein [Bordetella ansorpii]